MFIIKDGVESDQVGQGTEESTVESIKNWLGKEGYTIRTSDQDADYLKNNTQKEVNKMFANSKVEIENKIKEITGFERASDSEKAIEYLERCMTQLLNDKNTLSDKIKEFEEKGVDGNAQAAEYKNQLDALQVQYTNLKDEMKEQLSAKDNEIFMNNFKGQVSNEMAKISQTLDKSIKPEIMQDVIAARLNKFYAENKPVAFEDTIIFKDANGTTIQNKTDGKPKSTSEILIDYFGDLVDKGRQQGGSGSGDDGQGGEGGNDDDIPETPDHIKSKVELHSYIQEKLESDVNSKNFSKLYNAMGKDLPMRAPRK